MKFSDYKAGALKLIELPSGTKARIRNIKVMSYVLSGSLPNVFDIKTGEVNLSKKDDPSEVNKLVRNIVLDAVVALVFEDGEVYLRDAPAKQCKKNEMPYSMLKAEDEVEIFTKAFEMSVPGGADEITAFSG